MSLKIECNCGQPIEIQSDGPIVMDDNPSVICPSCSHEVNLRREIARQIVFQTLKSLSCGCCKQSNVSKPMMFFKNSIEQGIYICSNCAPENVLDALQFLTSTPKILIRSNILNASQIYNVNPQTLTKVVEIMEALDGYIPVKVNF